MTYNKIVSSPRFLIKWRPKLIKSELKIKRNFFFANFGSEYNLSCPLSPQHLPDLLDSLICQIIPAEALDGKTICDIKGREQNDEILYVAGNCLIENSKQKVFEPFSAQISTVFDEFVGSHHITHKSKVALQGLSDNFEIRNIARALPLEIKSFRIGLEVFTSRYFSSMLGFTPTVTQSLYIDCSQQEFRLQIEAESLKARNQLPLEHSEIFNRLDSCLAAAFNFRPLQDYLQKASAG